MKRFSDVSKEDRAFPDVSLFPLSTIFKGLGRKIIRRIFPNLGERFVWSPQTVIDVNGPAANVRNYLERKNIRNILTEISRVRKIGRACEIGCGYGRITMVLKEFSDCVYGFEREKEMVTTARELLPEINFEQLSSLKDVIRFGKPEFDFVMTCTVLQHIVDREVAEICDAMKMLAPSGHILLIEKTEAISVTKNALDGKKFLSKSRTIEEYSDFMRPFKLIKTWERIVEPTYFNPRPGTCMLFYQEK